MASSPHLVPKMLPAYAQDADRPYEGDPWSRQLRESPRAFSGFQLFLSLPPATRTFAEANRIYRERNNLPPLVTGSGPCQAWSSKHRWLERASAFDNFTDAKLVAANRRQLIRSATKHAQDAADIQTVLMLPMTKLRERIKAQGDTFGFIDGLTDEELTKLARSFASDVPMFQKAERESLASTSATVVTPREIKSKGEIVRRILADTNMIGLMEKVSFETVETLADADDSGTG